MMTAVRTRFIGGCTAAALTAAIALAACGSGHSGGAPGAAAGVSGGGRGGRSSGCARTVLDTLRLVAVRAYREGVSSERTASAVALITTSLPLREAVERGDAGAARTAAQALIATRHLTNLIVMRAGKVFVDVGRPRALAPLTGTLIGVGGAPIASFITSVWADGGFIDEIDGLAEGTTVLRSDGHSFGASLSLPAGLRANGKLTLGGVAYVYTSLRARAYPSGKPLRVYVLRTVGSTAQLCGATNEDTVVNTLRRVAELIYDDEAGPATLPQIHRVQHDTALLHAVARHEQLAAQRAILGVLNEHIVRLRVIAAGGVLADVGGPFVLAPVSAPLYLDGRAVGKLVLSIQDDEGYLRLARRLAGLDVLIYMGKRLVKNSLGPEPGAVPLQGPFDYRGRSFRTFTLHVTAFPAGPLRITVLVGIPYS